MDLEAYNLLSATHSTNFNHIILGIRFLYVQFLYVLFLRSAIKINEINTFKALSKVELLHYYCESFSFFLAFNMVPGTSVCSVLLLN